MKLIIEPTANNTLYAYIVSKHGSISLGFRENKLESWISWKSYLMDLSRVIGAKLINNTNFS